MKSLLMFPGQGSQYPGMGKDWVGNFSAAAQAFEEASDFSGLHLKKLCFEGTEEELKATEITQPAILTTTVAIFRSLKQEGYLADSDFLYAGHSLGEYSALVCAGSLGLGAAAKIVRHRGAYMQSAVPAGLGAMAALVFKPKTDGTELAAALCVQVAAATGKVVSVANENSPEQIVIAGEKSAVAEASQRALEEPTSARKAVELPVSAPFHCVLMQPAADKLAPELRAAPWVMQKKNYLANVDAEVHSLAETAAIAERLVRQITGQVKWTRSLTQALSQGVTQAWEIGPGKVLSGLAKRATFQDQGFATIGNVDRWEDFKNAGVKIG